MSYFCVDSKYPIKNFSFSKGKSSSKPFEFDTQHVRACLDWPYLTLIMSAGSVHSMTTTCPIQIVKLNSFNTGNIYDVL